VGIELGSGIWPSSDGRQRQWVGHASSRTAFRRLDVTAGLSYVAAYVGRGAPGCGPGHSTPWGGRGALRRTCHLADTPRYRACSGRSHARSASPARPVLARIRLVRSPLGDTRHSVRARPRSLTAASLCRRSPPCRCKPPQEIHNKAEHPPSPARPPAVSLMCGWLLLRPYRAPDCAALRPSTMTRSRRRSMT